MSDGIRAVNASGSDIPPFGVCARASPGMDVFGNVSVGPPSANGQTDVFFNGPAPLLAGTTGTVFQTFPCVAAYDPASVSPPADGDIWGCAAGSVFLQRSMPGFRIIGGGANGFCNVQRQTSMLTMFVQAPTPSPTTVGSGSELGGTYYSAIEQFVDSVQQTTTPGDKVWWWDLNGNVPHAGEFFKPILTGFAAGRKVYTDALRGLPGSTSGSAASGSAASGSAGSQGSGSSGSGCPADVLALVQVTSTTAAQNPATGVYYFPADVVSFDAETGAYSTVASCYYSDADGNWPLINSFHLCQLEGVYTDGGGVNHPVYLDALAGGALVIVQVTSVSLGSGGYPAVEAIWNKNGYSSTGDVCWYLDANGNAPTLSSYHLCLQTGNDGTYKIYQDAVNGSGGGSFTFKIGAIDTATSTSFISPWPATQTSTMKLALVTGTTAADESGVFLNSTGGPAGYYVTGVNLADSTPTPGTVSIDARAAHIQQLGAGNKKAPALFAAWTTSIAGTAPALNYQGFFGSSVMFTAVGANNSNYYLGEQDTPVWVGFGAVNDCLTISNTLGGGPFPITGSSNTGLGLDLIQFFTSNNGTPQMLFVGGGQSPSPAVTLQPTMVAIAGTGDVATQFTIDATFSSNNNPSLWDGKIEFGYQSFILGGNGIASTPAVRGNSSHYYGVCGPSGDVWGIYDADVWGNAFSGGLVTGAANYATLNAAYLAAGGGGTLPATGAQMLAALWTALNGLGAPPW